jgi:hypothetical protein
MLGSESSIPGAGLHSARRVNRGGAGWAESASQRPGPFPAAGKGWATPGCAKGLGLSSAKGIGRPEKIVACLRLGNTPTMWYISLCGIY